MRNLRVAIRILIVFLFLSLLIVILSAFIGKIEAKKYSVKGVDVSSYQGEIDWEILSENDIQFAFVKATEGSTHRDKFYEKNIENAKKTSLALGAYHFLSFESKGEAQAENFIKTVNKNDILLPPVIDLELYGEYNSSPPESEKVHEILDAVINELSREYGRAPIIYTNRRAYSLYLSGKYQECDIWICDVLKKPVLPDGRRWTFWQYSHTEKLRGYSGEEKHIDMNVFSGTEEGFLKYLKK